MSPNNVSNRGRKADPIKSGAREKAKEFLDLVDHVSKVRSMIPDPDKAIREGFDILTGSILAYCKDRGFNL